MSTTSRIPAFTDALYGAVNAAIGTTVNVIDGPPLDWATMQLAATKPSVNELNFVFIGARPDSTTSGDGTQDFNYAGNVSREEKPRIYCTSFANDDLSHEDVDMKAVRDTAFAQIATVEQALRADPSLGGVVLWAKVANIISWSQRQDEDGAACLVIFAVEATAYLD